MNRAPHGFAADRRRRRPPAASSEAIEATGAIVFAKACEMGLEGIVSKRAGSRYRSGTSRNWLKSKNPDFLRK